MENWRPVCSIDASGLLDKKHPMAAVWCSIQVYYVPCWLQDTTLKIMCVVYEWLWILIKTEAFTWIGNQCWPKFWPHFWSLHNKFWLELTTTVSSWKYAPLSKLSPLFNLNKFFPRVNAPYQVSSGHVFLMSFGLALSSIVFINMYTGSYCILAKFLLVALGTRAYTG